MTNDYRSCSVPRYIKVLCGATAEFDVESGISYRCHDCFAVVGSVGMPKRCKELYDMENVVDKLKGKSV
jgi:hypothetical protein